MDCYDINLKHLAYFIKVARLGSINKAAQLLYISQSHLGKILHDLEEALGVPLLNRSRQGVTLTPEGTAFLEKATHILAEMDSLHLQEHPSVTQPQPLSVSMTKFSHVMESFISVVRRYQNMPEFTHRLYEGQVDEVIADVLQGRVDIGVLHFDHERREEMVTELASQGLSYRFLAYAEPRIVISREHPLVRAGRPMTPENLAPYGFVRYLGLYDDVMARLFGPSYAQDHIGGKKEIFVTGRATLMNLISQTDFFSIGIHDFDKQLSDFHAVSLPIPGCEMKMEFGYITLEGVPLSQIGQDFLQEVKTALSRAEEHDPIAAQLR